MKRYQLRYFAWISLVLFTAVSCRSSKIFLSGDQATAIRESFFSGSFEKLSFKAKAIYKDRELTGLMLIKNAGDGNYKFAFYNELGMTYLEGTMANSSKHKKLVVENIAPIIDYKIFINNFERSLRMLLSDKTNPRFHAPLAPRSPASPPPAMFENILTVKLRNGFRLELEPQR